jgi:hypothetical protein
MSEAAVVRKRRSGVEVQRLVAEFEASGLTRDAFCQQRGLSLATLDKYRDACILDRDRSQAPCLPWKCFRALRNKQVAMPMVVVCWWLSLEAVAGSKCVVDSMGEHWSDC